MKAETLYKDEDWKICEGQKCWRSIKKPLMFCRGCARRMKNYLKEATK